MTLPLRLFLLLALAAASSAVAQAALSRRSEAKTDGLASDPTSLPTAFRIAEIPSPASPGARAAVLVPNNDGTLWMTWLEPAASGLALRCCAFDAAEGHWDQTRTIAASADHRQGGIPMVAEAPWLPSLGGLPALAAGPAAELTAAWTAQNPSPSRPGSTSPPLLLVTHSADRGLTWTPPIPLTRESADASFPALATLADGRVLAVWLDRRDRKAGELGASLYARFLTGREAAAPDTLLDAQACEGCQPSLAALLDGGAMLAYRERTEANVVDARILRLHGRRWEDRHEINSDHWDDRQGPREGPQLAVDGGRVAVGWFTAADRDPRVLLSISPDAGARFLLPLTAQAGHPIGPVSTTLLHDGAMLATWLEAQPGGSPTASLQRASPEFSLDPPISLGPVAFADSAGPPKIALVSNYSGEALYAQALVALVRPGAPTTLHTLLVTVPESALISAASDNCHCAPTPLQLLGFPVRGTVAAVSAENQTVTLDIDAVPGVMDAGPQVFSAERGALAALRPGRECLARIERQDSGWRLFDVRLLEK